MKCPPAGGRKLWKTLLGIAEDAAALAAQCKAGRRPPTAKATADGLRLRADSLGELEPVFQTTYTPSCTASRQPLIPKATADGLRLRATPLVKCTQSICAA